MTELAQHTEADPFATSLAGRRLGRYEVLARLATGGMASVYVARALGVAGFERLFAVKVLHPHLAHEEEFITMFLDEARLAARIRHPNVVPTTDISDTADAGYYLVMDYIEGDHLGALLQHAFRAHGRIPAPIVLRIIVDALEGLSAAHGLTDEHGEPLNLVHRDVSPHNIMVSTDGVARITDFGVAKASVRLSTTQDGQFKGKLAYMAPEHASNGRSDQRSDLFAMAIILWESLTGRRLFRAENHAATLNKICLEPIPLLSEVDPALAPFDLILQKGLARDPNERFQSAEEFAEGIEAHAEVLGGVANHRTVARLVREYAAEKLERDQKLIRAAVQELGQQVSAPAPVGQNGASYSGVAPRPAPQAATAEAVPADVPQPGATPAPSEPAAEAQSATPAAEGVVHEEAPRRRPLGLWLGAALAMVAVGVSAMTALWNGDAKPTTAAPMTENASAAGEPAAATDPAAAAPEPEGTDAPETEASAAIDPGAGKASDDRADGDKAADDKAAQGEALEEAPIAPPGREGHLEDGARAQHRELPAREGAPAARTTGTAVARPAARPKPRPTRPASAPRPTAPAVEPKPGGSNLPVDIEDDLMLNPYR